MMFQLNLQGSAWKSWTAGARWWGS